VLSHAEFLVKQDAKISNHCRWLYDIGADCHCLLHVDEFIQTRALSKPSKLSLVLVELKPTRSAPVADVGDAVM
jgi:hypothetical protein